MRGGRVVRFRGVVGRGVVADVLGGLENAEGEGGQEVPGGEQPTTGPHLEPRPPWTHIPTSQSSCL